MLQHQRGSCFSFDGAGVLEADESIGESFVLYVILKTVGHCWVDRLEKNFAVNVAGVYAITELLMPALELASPDGRVITVSSGGMYAAPLNEDLQYEHEKKFDGVLAYANNKRVQVSVIS
jgi:dehydrogenase/reductase SDR family protein 12